MAAERERRGHKRIKDKDISVKLSGEGFSAITQSLDVSASGLYCKVDRKIPVMTKLKIVLSIPSVGEPGAKNINVDGVVVREHSVREDGEIQHYDVAIFFDSLSQRNKKIITQYINSKSQEG